MEICERGPFPCAIVKNLLCERGHGVRAVRVEGVIDVATGPRRRPAVKGALLRTSGSEKSNPFGSQVSAKGNLRTSKSLILSNMGMNRESLIITRPEPTVI